MPDVAQQLLPRWNFGDYARVGGYLAANTETAKECLGLRQAGRLA